MDSGDKGKKALIVTTVSGFVPQFEMNNVHILQELGYEVHYASNFKNPSYGSDNRRLDGAGIICHQADMARSPFRILSLYRAYRQLKRLMTENSFALVHCHTPVGGALARLAARSVRNSTYNHENSFVIYTAHGFHFYKGAPFVNWLLYYPAERLLARYTDVLITMNREDYRRAGSFRLRRQALDGRKADGRKADGGKTDSRKNDGRKADGKVQVYRINGVGIDAEKYRRDPEERAAVRKRLGIRENEFLLLSVGELSKRKNHQAVIRALAKLQKGKACIRNWKYLIAGKGSERGRLEQLIRKNGLEGKVGLLGYRSDIRGLLAAADCFIFPSKQEGLPVALMEAMAAGLPCIAADIRGCRELLEPDELVKKNCAAQYAEKLLQAYEVFSMQEEGKYFTEAKKSSRKQKLSFVSEQRVKGQMREIYTACTSLHNGAG